MSSKTSRWRTVSGFGITSIGGALVMSAAALGANSLLEVEPRVGVAVALLLAGIVCTVQGCVMLRAPRANARADASDGRHR